MGAEKAAYSSVPVKEKCGDHPPPRKAPKGFGARHVQVLLLFISLTVGYTIRAQLSVSMVAITGHSVLTEDNHSKVNLSKSHAEFVMKNVSIHEPGDVGWSVYRIYKWHKPTQEMIIFSFFVGYTSMMIPMGLMAQKFGGKRPIMVALLVNGIISIISPWVPIFAGWVGLSVCRLLQGMTQAAFYPCIHTMLAKWAPLNERGRLSTYVYTGSQFGTILIFQISGLFAGSPSLGWPATFWLCGVLSLVMLGLFSWLGAATPHEDATITSEELAYIMEDGNADVFPKKRSTPWKHILTSTAVWGLVATHAGSASGYLLVLTQIPTYMNEVLGVDIKRNGVYSSMPYIAMYIMAIVFGFLSDFAVNRRIMSIANIRRTANTIGMVLSGIFLIAFSFVNSTLLAVVLLILSLGVHSGVHVGFHINQIDLAPNFAGPIMALGNMVANLVSLLVPVIVSNIVKDDMKNQHKWQIVFMIIGGFQFLTNAIFVIFVKGTVQPWNFYGEQETDTEKRS
ncbi:putative inorganic phosphate cotransporter isoform X2 [Manduca sexta]|uniref:putative inorganic phosphate cotransporter isoform X2 n=1 Tax=Manduca sexta TaxID=7130 RepID=UPI00188F4C6F|nr:putative inorganic phosphate cotransporter isoform X2 [Manduca sexta]